MKLFIFGYGYSAAAIATELRDHCDWIGATSRNTDKCADMEAAGLRAFLFDGNAASEDLIQAVSHATHILVSIAPDEAGDPVLRSLDEAIEQSRALEWVGYLSTVGVYGNHDGAWVDEEAECRPRSRRSVLRVAAEQAWLGVAGRSNIPVGIFRLAGIYGPGRNQMIKLAAGTSRAINKPGQVFNRIHRDDIALALSIAAKDRFSGILNLCDDEPAPPQDVIAYCANLMGLELPVEVPFEKAEMSAMARSFYGDNKRCANKRLHDLIGKPLVHPTFREAFRSMWENESWR